MLLISEMTVTTNHRLPRSHESIRKIATCEVKTRKLTFVSRCWSIRKTRMLGNVEIIAINNPVKELERVLLCNTHFNLALSRLCRCALSADIGD